MEAALTMHDSRQPPPLFRDESGKNMVHAGAMTGRTLSLAAPLLIIAAKDPAVDVTLKEPPYLIVAKQAFMLLLILTFSV